MMAAIVLLQPIPTVERAGAQFTGHCAVQVLTLNVLPHVADEPGGVLALLALPGLATVQPGVCTHLLVDHVVDKVHVGVGSVPASCKSHIRPINSCQWMGGGYHRKRTSLVTRTQQVDVTRNMYQ